MGGGLGSGELLLFRVGGRERKPDSGPASTHQVPGHPPGAMGRWEGEWATALSGLVSSMSLTETTVRRKPGRSCTEQAFPW